MICDKVTYDNRHEAEEAIKGISKDKGPTRSKKRPVRAYQCRGCGKWHLTSEKKKPHAPKSVTVEVHTKDAVPLNKPLKILDLTFRTFGDEMIRGSVLNEVENLTPKTKII
jgi:hypothetical protein